MEKKSVGLLELETAVLECFLEKTPLSPLGVNICSGFAHALLFYYTNAGHSRTKYSPKSLVNPLRPKYNSVRKWLKVPFLENHTYNFLM
jgi:hypothetical protein